MIRYDLILCIAKNKGTYLSTFLKKYDIKWYLLSSNNTYIWCQMNWTDICSHLRIIALQTTDNIVIYLCILKMYGDMMNKYVCMYVWKLKRKIWHQIAYAYDIISNHITSMIWNPIERYFNLKSNLKSIPIALIVSIHAYQYIDKSR